MILKNKTQDTYDAAFRIINELIPDLTPDVIKTDFEIAAISSLQTAFEGSRVSGCMFHLGQAINRKVKEGAASDYEYETLIYKQKFIRALCAMAFVKKEKIIDSLTLLQAESTFPASLNRVYNYFKTNYVVRGSRFPLSLWHCLQNCDSVPRTNNAIEGWHCVFRNFFGTSRYIFDLLIKKLIDIEDVIHIRSYQQDTMNIEFRRRAEYVTMEENLENYLFTIAEMKRGLTIYMV